jgi:nicotinamidase-related amidase
MQIPSAMKNTTIALTLLLMSFSGTLYAQDAQTPAKPPIKPALVVIDIQNAFLPMMDEKDKKTGMEYINYLITLFRASGYPVIRVYHTSKEYGVIPDTEPFEFPTTVKIKPDDPKVIKTYPDGFNKTDLDKVIKETGSNTLFLCGLSAVGCVLATYIGAQNHDYKAYLCKNALISHNAAYTDTIEEIFEAVSFEAVQMILQATRQ